MPPAIRSMHRQDVSQGCALLNDIILAGGTTAYEIPFSDALFAQTFLDGADLICCHVALDGDGHVAGFQWLGQNAGLPPGCADIATFARRAHARGRISRISRIGKIGRTGGIGTALFTATLAEARRAGLTAINATIRADNVPGLGYYAKMGFTDHSVTPAVPLRDGTPVHRVSKRYVL